ncbi:UDP-N-acetylmuramoyl-L-alanyl-D-glutamate--2,6-diaminopimelate ligase [Hutsoniella sourekii]
MNQKELIDYILDKQVQGPAHLLNNTVTKLVNDHREIIPGACYVAIKGENFDGHQVLEQAIELGAELIVVEEEVPPKFLDQATVVRVPSTYRTQALLANLYYGQPSTQLNLVAITGTNGKTTTSSMISDLLELLQRPTGLIGTLHYKVADQLYPAVNTTPNAVHLQSLFRQMLDQGCQDAIIEASSHALELGRLWYTDVDCAIYTNLTREHLDFHQDMDHYAMAKSLLFSQLGQRLVNGRPRIAILNKDDSYWRRMLRATSAEILTYSLEDPTATAYAHSIEENDNQLTFTIRYQDHDFTCLLPMIGIYNVSNFLAAFLCLTNYYHFKPEQVIQAIQSFKGVTGRMQVVDQGQDFLAVVDFAHTADAVDKVLEDLKNHTQGRLISMMGHSGGNRDSGARPGIGEALFKWSDYVVLTADNPRNESVHHICQEMLPEQTKKSYQIIEDRKKAIQFAVDLAQAGDTILFAGKGGEPYQIIGDQSLPFDEVAEVRQAIQKRIERNLP